MQDHEPLFRARGSRNLICLYIYEPEVLTAPDFSDFHLSFVNDSLIELHAELRSSGNGLLVKSGEAVSVLAGLHDRFRFNRILSHEETGNGITYARDLRVAAWCRENGVEWLEFPQNGVVRPLNTRNGWSRRWNQRMSGDPFPRMEALPPVPGKLESATTDKPAIRDARGLEVSILSRSNTELQRGGAKQVRVTLESFLDSRGANYQKEMSSPVTAFNSCSRLSPYLAYGNISMRQVYRRSQETSGLSPGARKAFNGRLHWHCHFMQKLEDEPRTEFENVNRAYDGLRESEFNEAFFQAWAKGETGFPMVDACMQALHRYGWINFRMRAMLVSFSSYNLWLHWRQPALHLARLFTDYEPGIHYSQIQMQSGTTGINTNRIYSPIKQVLDQDPEGVFIRRMLPMLERVPTAYLSQPEKMPLSVQKECGCVIGKDYPAPIVDHKEASRMARQRIGQVRKGEFAREESERILQKHGSRKRSGARGTSRSSKKRSTTATTLPDKSASQDSTEESQLFPGAPTG